ncbi:ABC transporter substrate-binding protein [Micromonospora carbonacea]|uniref:ABC transporter substrate-binding protein n=1 Tax=Micromonospora carbonacea TaxID=47853 RepID=UPI00159F067A|nr:ABC transporter substrate-binding protein [Micromonospora carbonacea]
MSVALAASLVACGSSDNSTGSDNADTHGQALRVAVDALPGGKGSPFNTTGTPEVYTHAAIYDQLTLVDQDGTVKPWLATSWKNTSDTTWTFTLRSGVKFSNGEVLDAQGVADVITFVKTDPEVSKQAVAGDLRVIASAKALDAATVEITTTAVDPLLPNKMTELFIPAPKVLAQKGNAGITSDPVGTGPFKVQDWSANKITLTANTDSWRAPKVGTLEIQALPDPASRMQALQSGQVDLITAISPDQGKQLTGNYRAEITKAAQVMSLAFINTKGDTPMASPKVRQALNYAVDKDAIAQSLLLGQGEAVGQGTSAKAAGYNPDIKPFPYDVNKAKQLMAEAGYPNGFEITVDVVVGSYPADAEIYQLVKGDLAKVGVSVNLRQITFANWLKFYLANSWDSQAFGLSWNSLPTMDGARAMSLFSCLKQPAFFCDQPTADLLKQALTNLNPDARSRQLQTVGQAMHDNPPALYLVRQIDINGLSDKLQGFANNNRFLPYDKMYKS